MAATSVRANSVPMDDENEEFSAEEQGKEIVSDGRVDGWLIWLSYVIPQRDTTSITYCGQERQYHIRH